MPRNITKLLPDNVPASLVITGMGGMLIIKILSEAGELIEKVNIADAGLEDTVVEMCKWVTARELAEKYPSFGDSRLRFLRTDGADNDLVFAFAMNGEMKVLNVGFNVYEDARRILSRNPSVRPSEGFARVNGQWLERFFQ